MEKLTKKEVRKNYNLSAILTLGDYDIELFLIYTGGSMIEYVVFLKEEVLFDGNDYKPSPLHSIDSLDSAINLLGFLTVQKGDTDDEYFKNYTANQLEWSESFACEQLKGLISDFEYEDKSDPIYHQNAVEYFSSKFQNV